jgi:hypothetical protein
MGDGTADGVEVGRGGVIEGEGDGGVSVGAGVAVAGIAVGLMVRGLVVASTGARQASKAKQSHKSLLGKNGNLVMPPA